MKKIILATLIVLSLSQTKTVSAQVSVGVNFNIGIQPLWGPTGYDYVENYYLPEIDMYYNVPKHQYIYMDHGHWVFVSTVPSRYGYYDFKRGYKVVINERDPYLNAPSHRIKYAGYRNNHNQVIILNSHETKYYESKSHPNHGKWENEKGNKGKGNNGHNGKHKD